MIAPAVEREAARQPAVDPALPGLARALDPATVAELLVRRGALPAGTALAIAHVRYHPREGAWITYEVEGAPQREAAPGASATGAAPTRLLYGRLDPPGIEPLVGHERDGGAPAGAIVLLPEIPMVVRFFPQDAVLRRLAEVCRFGPVKRRVEAELAAEGLGWKIKRTTALGTVVRYKPERRCVFRLHLDLRGRSSARKRRLALYGQVDSDGAGAPVGRVLAELAAAIGVMGPVAVPRLLLYEPRLDLLLQEEIEGVPLLTQLGRDDMKKVVRRLAGRLADLQRSGVVAPRALGLEDRLRALAEVEAFLAAAGGELGETAGAVLGALESRAEPPPVAGFLHGDFHAGQVLVRGRRSWIVDFDRAAIGDPLIDPATFVAGLWLEAAEGRLARELARRAGKVFLRGYAEAWPEAFDPERFRWQLASTLLESAAAPLRQLRAGWPRLVARRLELAARVTAGGEVLP